MFSELVEAERFQAGQDMRSGKGVVLRLSSIVHRGCQRSVDDLQEIVGVERRDTLVDETVLDLGVFVQVSDLGDHAESDADGWEACTAAEAGECVEEVVGSAVVAFCCHPDTSGDGAGHEKEVKIGVFTFDGVMDIPRSCHFWIYCGVPLLVRHCREQRFLVRK